MGAKLIILRHGEKPKGKKSSLQLSSAGKARAQAIAQNYLGKGASKPLLGKKGPDAFYAITPHTLETASPSAESWGMPITTFFAVASGAVKDAALDTRTQDAAKSVHHALKHGKTVVMVWEHHRIAGAATPKSTLRELLNLDRLDTVPVAWPDDDYDTIWIFDCSKKGKPLSFSAVPQQFKPGKHKP